MNGAAKYIDQLQNSLVCRIRTHGFPDKLKAYSGNGQDSQSIRSSVDSYIVNQGAKKK